MSFYIPDLMIYFIAIVSMIVVLIMMSSLERKRFKEEEESKKNAAILGYNYPQSIWYKFIYEDITNKSNETIYSKTIGKFFN